MQRDRASGRIIVVVYVALFSLRVCCNGLLLTAALKYPLLVDCGCKDDNYVQCAPALGSMGAWFVVCL